MRKHAWLLGLALVVAGCADKPKVADVATVKELTLTGSGGSVQLGDSLEQAKKAFPPPVGAEVVDTSMSFAVVTKTGWAWAVEATKPEGFEAATRDNKIVAMGRTSGTDEGLPQKMIAELGEPTRKADSKTAIAYVWESGDNARFLIEMKHVIKFMAFKTMVLIGSKKDLEILNYHSDDPNLIVTQLDAAAEQMNSPELKKMFEEAKKRALAKQKKKAM